MIMNTFGNIYRLTTFGESHGPAVGGIIDGMPAGIDIDLDAVQHQLDRRRPGQSTIVTARDEKDRVKILSGMFDGKTTGTPIGFIVENGEQHASPVSWPSGRRPIVGKRNDCPRGGRCICHAGS